MAFLTISHNNVNNLILSFQTIGAQLLWWLLNWVRNREIVPPLGILFPRVIPCHLQALIDLIKLVSFLKQLFVWKEVLCFPSLYSSWRKDSGTFLKKMGERCMVFITPRPSFSKLLNWSITKAGDGRRIEEKLVYTLFAVVNMSAVSPTILCLISSADAPVRIVCSPSFSVTV